MNLKEFSTIKNMSVIRSTLNKLTSWCLPSIIIPALVSIAGTWYTYKIASSTLELDKHSEISNSFKDQIESIIARNDRKEEEKIRRLFEKFEEDWRRSQLLSSKLNNAITIGLDKISKSEKNSILDIYNSLDKNNLFLSNLDKAGIDYLSGNYQSSSSNYSRVLEKEPENTKAFYYGSQALIKATKNNPNYEIPIKELDQYKKFENIRDNVGEGNLIHLSNELKNIEKANNKQF